MIIRADELRHRALSYALENQGYKTISFITDKQKIDTQRKSINGVINNHFFDRRVSEKFFFGHSEDVNLFAENFRIDDINSNSAIETANRIEPEYLITFGCPILSNLWIEKFPHKILGIHLGLSPYYRGSGCNFWPIHEKEFACLGFTLMELGRGIDTGNIYHQERTQIRLRDTIHTIGNRTIENMISSVGEFIRKNDKIQIRGKSTNFSDSKLYLRKHFTEDAILKANMNLSDQNISLYNENIEAHSKNYPIVQATGLI